MYPQVFLRNLLDPSYIRSKEAYLSTTNCTSKITQTGKCAPEQDTNRILTSQITYTDKNTSGIQPKAMNKKQIKHFFEFLLNSIQPTS